jgi:hypothetical protein
MRKIIHPALLLILLSACSAGTQSTTASKKDNNTERGHTRTIAVESIDAATYLLTDAATDKTYGYTEKNAVKVGGNSDSNGPKNERRFLNALLGPNGEQVTYFRAGSCCHFKTPNGMIDNMGLLDQYRVSWVGSKDTVNLYLNMYDKGNLLIPIGFTAKAKQ